MTPRTWTVAIYNTLNMLDSIEHGLDWDEVEEAMKLFYMDALPGARIEITREED